MRFTDATKSGSVPWDGGPADTVKRHGCEDRIQVKISVDRDVAVAFKAACAVADASMASAMSRFMTAYAGLAPAKRNPLADYSTRRHRRAAIKNIALQLGKIREGEGLYLSRIPENIQGSSVSDSAEEILSYLDEAIDALDAIAMM